MAKNEKGCPGEGSPILKGVLADNQDLALPAINLQVSRLIQRCAISAAMAETLAPLVFGGAVR
jgi:hypothetical protein